MGRIRDALPRLYLQAYFLSYWGSDAKHVDSLQEQLPSLFAVMLDVCSTQGAKELGNFISTIRASTILIATFLLQTPTQAQISDYCEDVRGMVLEYCPHFAVHDLQFTELAAFLQVKIEHHFAAEPAARRHLPSLLPLNNQESMFRAMEFNKPTTDDFFALMLKNLVIMFRKHGMSFRYFFWISRGFHKA
jgi:hypothetical protein